MSDDMQLIVDIAEGKTTKEIACEWHRSLKTIEWRWSRVKRMFGFRTYVDACRFAIKKEWIKV